MSGAPSIEVSPVRGRRDREAFLRLPWRLYRGNPAWVPPLLAERRRGIEAALVARTVRAAIARGYRSGELSWILESNAPMRRLLERLGAQLDKTYRLYERAL